MKRVSLSLPDDLVDDLDGVARILGSSRAGLIAAMLHEMNLSEMRRLLAHAEKVKAEGDSEGAKRFRGESAEYIISQLGKALNPQGGLFDDVER